MAIMSTQLAGPRLSWHASVHARRRVDARTRTRATLIGAILCGVGTVLGCANDATGPVPLTPAQLYYQLTLNHHAITLALTPPYNTLQLVAMPHAATGAVLVDRGVTTWTSSDTSSVRVSATGVLTALTQTTEVTVLASHTIGTVTQTDSAVVNVNDVASIPHLATLTLQPNPDLFAQVLFGVFGGIAFVPNALDASGTPIPNVVVRVTSLTPAILQSPTILSAQAQALTSQFTRITTGHASLLVEATVYGVHLVDTVPFLVGWWPQKIVHVQPQYPAGSRTLQGVFSPGDDTVAVGGTVFWRNELLGSAQVDIVFDDSSAVQAVDSATVLGGIGPLASLNGVVIPNQSGGNIPPFAPLDTGALRGTDGQGVRARSFPTAGTYQYHSTVYGTSGVIHVLPESQVP